MIIALPTRLLYMLVSAFLVRAVDLGSSECCISQHYRDSRPGLCFRATTRTYKLDPKRNRSSSKPGASHPTPMYEWTRSFVLTFRLQPSLVVPVLAFFSSPSSADAAGGKKKKKVAGGIKLATWIKKGKRLCLLVLHLYSTSLCDLPAHIGCVSREASFSSLNRFGRWRFLNQLKRARCARLLSSHQEKVPGTEQLFSLHTSMSANSDS